MGGGGQGRAQGIHDRQSPHFSCVSEGPKGSNHGFWQVFVVGVGS